ncbi:MAG: hypothetical protein K9I74_05560 [Bacteroidales bacterium]|nr:hypothetical protein [Bacteroidales bacterium]
MIPTLRNIFILLVFSIVSFTSVGQSPEIHGYVRNYTGALTGQNGDFSIVQNTLELDIEKTTFDMAFKANPYIYQYAHKDELDYGLREAYIDLYTDNMDIRLGKQQIIWGKADGVFITDVVSPKDLREFLLPNFDEIRQGITAAKIDYYSGNNTFELVWAPVFVPTHYPEKESIWFPKSYPDNYIIDKSEKNVKAGLENSELFFKYSRLSSTFDVELMAGYMWDDDPAMHTRRYMDPQTMTLDSVVATPRHHRLNLFGGSVSTEIEGIVLRSEAAYYMDKKFATQNPANRDGITEKDYAHYLVGVDFIVGGANVSLQFIQETIMDYEDPLAQDEYSNTMTFLVNDDYLNDKLTLELFAYIGLDNEDALIRPKATYELHNGLNLITGANLFTGTKGRFGQYNANDMAYFKLRYDF